MNPDAAREALRQQMLLRALWRDARPAGVAGWMRDGARFERGLQAYQAHAGALAERALAAAYPTIRQLLGDASFAALARAFWQRDAPQRGDIAQWGGALADFIAAAPQLAAEPYLADVARLEWAVQQAEHAADGGLPQGLEHLRDTEPAQLRLRLAPGTALVESAHPIVAIWHAHRDRAGLDDATRFADVRAAFAAGRAEAALVCRRGWAADVLALDPADARFTRALLAGDDLAAALQQAGPHLDFEAWLLQALQAGTLAAVEPLEAGTPAQESR